jgi:hypothetical protein
MPRSKRLEVILAAQAQGDAETLRAIVMAPALFDFELPREVHGEIRKAVIADHNPELSEALPSLELATEAMIEAVTTTAEGLNTILEPAEPIVIEAEAA